MPVGRTATHWVGVRVAVDHQMSICRTPSIHASQNTLRAENTECYGIVSKYTTVGLSMKRGIVNKKLPGDLSKY